MLITVVAANQSQRRRSKSKASPPVVSGSSGLDQVNKLTFNFTTIGKSFKLTSIAERDLQNDVIKTYTFPTVLSPFS